MKNSTFKILATLVLLSAFQCSRAQCNNSYAVDCLGVHCYITVDLNNDPVTSMASRCTLVSLNCY